MPISDGSVNSRCKYVQDVTTVEELEETLGTRYCEGTCQ